jgi:hypothetical protein
MSVRTSILPPRVICSGAMYFGEPMNEPSCVRSSPSIESSPTIFTMPKSTIFTSSSPSRPRSSMTFEGLRSRWMTPWACASVSPRAICRTMWTVSLVGRDTRSVMRRASVSPEQNSIEMKNRSPSDCSIAP